MAKKKTPEHWTLGKWGELTQYCCKYCPFDSLDETTIREHYLKVHLPESPAPEINVPVTRHIEEQVN